MIKLNPYADRDLALVKAIFLSKRKVRRTRLLNAVPKIAVSCSNYEDHTGELSGVSLGAYGRILKSDFLHCYNVRTDKLNLLKKNIIECQPAEAEGVCQYCGIAAWKSIDHYLPKEKFAHLSIYSSNMVPCCKDCNGLKGSIWLKLKKRQILSMYYDDFPAKKYLKAKVICSSGSFKAVFSLSEDAKKYCGMRRIIHSHFRRLNLLERYSEAAIKQLSEHRKLVTIFAVNHSASQTAKFIKDYANSIQPPSSPNYWKACLLIAASKCPEFCQR